MDELDGRDEKEVHGWIGSCYEGMNAGVLHFLGF